MCWALRNKVKQSQPDIDQLKNIYQALANYYQIALGSSQGESYDFEIDTFCKKFDMKSVTVYPVLKKLEEFGLIELNESFYRPSVLHISMDKKRLYEFQVAHVRYDLLIKTLMRLYGGELYTDFTTISETQIAQVMKLTAQEVKIELEQLHKLQLMVYEPKNESPKITFILPRQDAERLPIDRVEFDRRRDLHFAKMEAMINYVEQDHRCRMQLIQEYFDEVTYANCGMCDVCIQGRSVKTCEAFTIMKIRSDICSGRNRLTVEELETLVDPKDKELFIEVVREMVDAGEIYYDELWVLRKINK